MLQSNKKAEPRFAMLFSRLQRVILNDFVLFLKQESGSRGQGSKDAKAKCCTRGRKVKEFLNLFQIQEI